MIDIAVLWNDIRIASNMSASGESEQIFLSAVNSVIRDLSVALDDDYDEMTSVDGANDIPAYTMEALFMGARYHLQRRGAWAQDPDPEALNLYQIEKNLCKTAKMRANAPLVGIQSSE